MAWGVAVLLAAVPAVLCAVALWGRTTATGMTLRWAATFVLGWAVAAWWLVRGRRERDAGGWDRVAGAIPPAAFALAVLASLYASNEAYHAWTFAPLPKGTILPLSVLLVFLAPGIVAAVGATDPAAAGANSSDGAWARLHRWLGEHRTTSTRLALGGVAVAHALSFSGVATDDLIRYWAIADAWAAGAPYAVAEGAPDAGQFYLIDPPVYPALVALCFGIFGHRYAALHAPLVLANLALPFLLHGAARAAGAGRLVSLVLTLVVVSFPPYQVYALGSPEPDPLWAAELAALAWLTLRCARTDRAASGTDWMGLGAVAAALTLTRPEGPLYAGPALLGLVVWRLIPPHLPPLSQGARGNAARARWARWERLHGPAIACVVAAGPVVAFSGLLLWAFRIAWPTGWGNVASARYVWPNVNLVWQQNLPHYAATAGLPAPEVMGPVVAVVLAGWVALGYVALGRRFPALWLAPLAVAANLAVIFMSPTYLAADHLSPPTFFRHFAICVPWLAPPLAAGLAAVQRRLWAGTWTWAATALAAVVLWGELDVLGGAAARHQAGRLIVLTSDPYVLVTDLWQANDGLPQLPFVPGPGRGVSIDTAFPYMAFRGGLFDAVRPYDLHVNDAGRAHMRAAVIVGVAGLLLVAASGRRDQPGAA